MESFNPFENSILMIELVCRPSSFQIVHYLIQESNIPGILLSNLAFHIIKLIFS